MDLNDIFAVIYLVCFPCVVAVLLTIVYNRLPNLFAGPAAAAGDGEQQDRRQRVCVMVLGDIGRSPRMQYHSLSLADNGYCVDVVGYGGSIPHEEFRNNDHIQQHIMGEPPKLVNTLPRFVGKILKGAWQAVILLVTLSRLKRTEVIFSQNPPAIPSLAMCLLVSFVKNCKFVIDWHNYGYTILGLSLGQKHPLVKIAYWYEHLLGRFADENICVTDAMKDDLKMNWNITADTMYDRPPIMFHETEVKDQHELFSRLSKEYPCFAASNGNANETAFTQDIDGNISLKESRPAFIMSSTSWTEDEDFSILFKALEDYELKAKKKKLPKVICAITGKGPKKAEYQKLIAEKSWNVVSIITPWLEAEDYPTLLGSADMGVCLHMSSSGLDLPMKVVDMFGCGLPVCAIQFACLHELVKHEENGLVFNSAQQLTTQIQDLLSDFPEKTTLNQFHKNLKTFQSTRWTETWNDIVLPKIQALTT
ncbi:chitobiosyldiphosphodolichol beta-mannosyltransferase-like [Tubulanus polymorphus]|uniref:chitobiosyldiphosphodolichol beta-mannosyltransferase-like n=1 Tax=Tubulanus polymorphus TaxID=672921 RepID=UPI003DA57C07